MSFMEIWVDLGLLHPLVLFSMAIGFVFSLVSSLLIFEFLFRNHKAYSAVLLAISFLAAAVLSFAVLQGFYKTVVGKASVVGVGGFPFNLIFEFLPPVGGLALSYYLIIRRGKTS